MRRPTMLVATIVAAAVVTPAALAATATPFGGATVNGDELANPKFDPFWAKAEELGALVFIHPQPSDEARREPRSP